MEEEIASTLDVLGDFNRLLIEGKAITNIVTDAINESIELNKYRIKMKPITAREKYGDYHSMTLSPLIFCPKCKTSIGKRDNIRKFCNECGQAILK